MQFAELGAIAGISVCWRALSMVKRVLEESEDEGNEDDK